MIILTEEEKQEIIEKAEADGNYYDIVERYENCTVEILRKSWDPDDVSIGWYRNSAKGVLM